MKNTLKKMIARWEADVQRMELLLAEKADKLDSMDARQRTLGNKGELIEQQLLCIDNARMSIEQAIEEINNALEL